MVWKMSLKMTAADPGLTEPQRIHIDKGAGFNVCFTSRSTLLVSAVFFMQEIGFITGAQNFQMHSITFQ